MTDLYNWWFRILYPWHLATNWIEFGHNYTFDSLAIVLLLLEAVNNAALHESPMKCPSSGQHDIIILGFEWDTIQWILNEIKWGCYDGLCRYQMI